MPDWNRENPDELPSHDWSMTNVCLGCGMTKPEATMAAAGYCVPSAVLSVSYAEEAVNGSAPEPEDEPAPVAQEKPARGRDKMSRAEARSASMGDLLEQRKWWRSGGGEVSRRRDLQMNHRLNIMALLVRNAGNIAWEYANQSVFYDAPDDVQADLARIAADPDQWIMSMPLWQAMLQDVMSFADIGPSDLGLHLRTDTDPSYGEVWTTR